MILLGKSSFLFICLTLALALPCLASDECKRTDALNLKGQIVFTFPKDDYMSRRFVLQGNSGTNALVMVEASEPIYSLGDFVDVCGPVDTITATGCRIIAQQLKITGHSPLAKPKSATISDVLSGDHDYGLVRIRGVVTDVFRDEIGPVYHWMIVRERGQTIGMPWLSDENVQWAEELIDAEIEVQGCALPVHRGGRRHMPEQIYFTGQDSVHVLKDAPHDPFAVPSISFLPGPPATHRRLAHGYVTASWHGNKIFLETKDGILQVWLKDNSPLPAVGTSICASGFPETDNFSLRLTRAIWRQEEPSIDTQQPHNPTFVTPKHMTTNNSGEYELKTDYNGQLISVSGSLQSPPANPLTERMYLDCNGTPVPIVVSAVAEYVKKLPPGAHLEVSGICLLEFTDDRLPNGFPRATGFSLITRTTDDIHVISLPSWWTTTRLLAALAILLLATLTVGIWNFLLKRTSDRKGREIAAQRMTIVESQLKVCERTRLSVELHDALSQTLSAISMQIDAVRRYAGRDDEKMKQHLDIAAKTIGSCQTELHNCLWDLRNSTLDAANMDEAVRQTVNPHIGEAKLDVRFNVPRNRFCDNTAHTILRIVRELVSNAIRHGKATHVRIAGLIEGDWLMVSVRDNGLGFDPNSAPGICDGHFGLQGIRERIEELDGVFKVESTPGHGTRATFRLHIPPEFTS